MRYLLSSKDLGEETVVQAFPKLEIFNSHFTSNYGEWALGFCGGIYGKDNPGCALENEHPLQNLTSLDLSNRGIRSFRNKVRGLAIIFAFFFLLIFADHVVIVSLPEI